MQRIVILGGGVGGTLTANLLVKKLRRRIDRGEVTITVVDATGHHVYQPGFMYIAMGGERAANLQRPERSLLDKRVTLVVGEVAKVDEVRQVVTLGDALDAFDGGRIVIGIAGMPYKCPPAPLEVAFLIESEMRDRKIRDRTTIDFCSPIGRAFTIESVSD